MVAFQVTLNARDHQWLVKAGRGTVQWGGTAGEPSAPQGAQRLGTRNEPLPPGWCVFHRCPSQATAGDVQAGLWVLGDGQSEPFQSAGTETGGVMGTEHWVEPPCPVGAVGSSDEEGGSHPGLESEAETPAFQTPPTLAEPHDLLLSCCPSE